MFRSEMVPGTAGWFSSMRSQYFDDARHAIGGGAETRREVIFHIFSTVVEDGFPCDVRLYRQVIEAIWPDLYVKEPEVEKKTLSEEDRKKLYDHLGDVDAFFSNNKEKRSI
jgi:hypothetical protein